MSAPFRRRARRVLTGRAALEASAVRRGDAEHQHQVALVQWAKLMAIATHPELDLLFAVPNGGFRMTRTAGRLFAEGLRPGVPDLVLPLARHGYHGLFLEMKAPVKTARVTEHQRAWLEKLTAEGYCVGVAYGVDAGQAALEWYVTPKANGAELDRARLATFRGAAVTPLGMGGVASRAFCWHPAEMRR